MKISFKYLICLAFALSAFIQVYASAPKDSLRVTVVNNKKFIMHKVDKGEGMLAIARRYNVASDQIQFEGKKDKLKQGDILLIPLNAKDTGTAKSNVDAAHANADVAAEVIYKHKVSKGETLNRIAQLYKISVNDLVKWNNVRDNRIEIGQVLIVNPLAAVSPDKPWNRPQPLLPVPLTRAIDSNLQVIDASGLAMVSALSTSTLLSQNYDGYLLVTNLDNMKQVIVKSEAKDSRTPELTNIILELDARSSELLVDPASGKVLRVSVKFIEKN